MFNTVRSAAHAATSPEPETLALSCCHFHPFALLSFPIALVLPTVILYNRVTLAQERLYCVRNDGHVQCNALTVGFP
jgi:hypothetical protein